MACVVEILSPIKQTRKTDKQMSLLSFRVDLDTDGSVGAEDAVQAAPVQFTSLIYYVYIYFSIFQIYIHYHSHCLNCRHKILDVQYIPKSVTLVFIFLVCSVFIYLNNCVFIILYTNGCSCNNRKFPLGSSISDTDLK